MSTPTRSVSPDLLAILRDPYAIQLGDRYGADPGQLTLIGDSWLVSADTGYKYPIRDGIPVMLVEEGARWKDTPVDALPVPPPPAAPAPPVNVSASDIVQTSDEQTNLVVLAVAGGLLLLGGIVGISWLRSRSKSSDGS